MLIVNETKKPGIAPGIIKSKNRTVVKLSETGLPSGLDDSK